MTNEVMRIDQAEAATYDHGTDVVPGGRKCVWSAVYRAFLYDPDPEGLRMSTLDREHDDIHICGLEHNVDVSLLKTYEDHVYQMSFTEDCLLIYIDGELRILNDDMGAKEFFLDSFLTPLQGAIWVARFRAWADMFELLTRDSG